MFETSHQSRFDAQNWMLGAGALDDPELGYGDGGGRRVQDGEHRYTVVDSFRYLAKLIKYCKV